MDASSRPWGSHEDPGQLSIIEGGGNEVGGPNVFIHLRSNVGLRGAPTEKGGGGSVVFSTSGAMFVKAVLNRRSTDVLYIQFMHYTVTGS